MENVRNHRDVKLITNKARSNLFSFRTELSYNKYFFKKLIRQTK